MVIVDDMWLQSEEFLTKYVANTFKVVIQLGSILAVVIIFWKRFLDLLGLRRQNPAADPAGAAAETINNGQGRLKLTHVIIGLIPAGLLGVLTEDYIDEHLFSTKTVLIGLVLG